MQCSKLIAYKWKPYMIEYVFIVRGLVSYQLTRGQGILTGERRSQVPYSSMMGRDNQVGRLDLAQAWRQG
jgi:hypothetical protein